jgi:hypothetical protein
MSNQSKSPQDAKNQGEGNRDADRQYRDAATRHAQSGKTEGEARQAEEALDGDEAKELAEAEKKGKSPAKGPASR